MRRARVVLLTAAAAITMSCGAPAEPAEQSATSSTVSTTPVSPTVMANSVSPDPRVGAIFLDGQSLHTCTGSVLHSVAGDLILTAAHCMAAGYDTSFVPGFVESADPQDFWTIDEVYLDPRWVAAQDPLADFAIARVIGHDRGTVENAVGGGLALGSGPGVGADVTVTGYALGVGGGPIGCTARTTARERGFPSLRCPGLVDGTSGSPWTTGSTVVGVIGGLEGGGCEENVSYTPPFDDSIKQLMARAEAGGPGDDPPTVFSDDC